MSDTSPLETVQNREWCEQQLGKLDFVTWDRFTVGEWAEDEQSVSIYGWIDRPDSHEDFVLLILWPEHEDIYTITSSDEWTEEISRRLFGSASGHNDCRRAEDTFDVENVVTLGEQTTLSDGGSDD